MKRSKGKRRRCGGFTLIEMLIVVAIIAVLVAVSIPMVSASLEKARVAVDDANERAAKAAALADYLMEERTGHVTYFYKSDGTATIITRDEDWPPAGTPGYDYGQSGDQKGGYVKVDITVEDSNTNIDIEWEKQKVIG